MWGWTTEALDESLSKHRLWCFPQSPRCSTCSRRRSISATPRASFATITDVPLTSGARAMLRRRWRASLPGTFRLLPGPTARPGPYAATPMADALRTGQATRDGEIVMERPDGSRVTVMIESEAIRDGDGHIIGVIDVLQDITERNAASKSCDGARSGFAGSLPRCRRPCTPPTRRGGSPSSTPPPPSCGVASRTSARRCGAARSGCSGPTGTPLPHDQCPMAVAAAARVGVSRARRSSSSGRTGPGSCPPAPRAAAR